MRLFQQECVLIKASTHFNVNKPAAKRISILILKLHEAFDISFVSKRIKFGW